MKITSKYLVFPVNLYVTDKTVLFYDKDGKLVFEFWSCIDTINPEAYMYLDVERFRGMELTVKTEPEMDIEFGQTDEKPLDELYNCRYRPLIHFTAANGWLNDPNGLVYHNGTYHLFFQYNPAAPDWGNCHWGHATSTDLIHWTEGEIALYPDERGMAASGSGFVDTKNASGLSPDGNTILLFYTREGGFMTRMSEGQQFHQYLAYSTDGGKTFIDYEKNPIVPWQVHHNRDPKVVWSEELGVYVMALYMNDNDFWLFESHNFLDWTLMQKMTLPDDTECPNLFLCDVENEPGEKRWVFAGAADTYVVGHFDKDSRSFVIDSDSKHYYHFKNGRRASYAAQTFACVPDRCVKMSWISHAINGTPFKGVMGIPCEMILVKRDGEYYLKGNPVLELDSLVCSTETHYGSAPIRISSEYAYDITVKAPRNCEDFSISIYGRRFEVKCSENTFQHGDTVTPLSYTEGDLDIRIIADTLTLEVFLDGGLTYTVCEGMHDRNVNHLTVTSTEAEITVKALESIRK